MGQRSQMASCEGVEEVMFEVDGVHTAERPYCSDLGCRCHTDVVYHDWVAHPGYLDDDVEQAYSFYELTR